MSGENAGWEVLRDTARCSDAWMPEARNASQFAPCWVTAANRMISRITASTTFVIRNPYTSGETPHIFVKSLDRRKRTNATFTPSFS